VAGFLAVHSYSIMWALTMVDRSLSFALFDTAIGQCGIVWNARGVAGVQLPASSERATRNRISRRYPSARESAAPPDIEHVMQRLVALLAGEPSDLSDVEIDTADTPDFNRRVYEIARQIPAGATLTYGQIAARLGDRSLAREVGEALGQNPIPIIVPCHRVLAADGKAGGFSGPGGVRTKLRLLEIEGAQPGGPTLFGDLPLMAPPRRQRRRT
jgi:methylated-DNA-[protein]-cysteine S-methyltransferase